MHLLKGEILFLFCLLILLISNSVSKSKPNRYSPLILVPGDGGSRIYVRSTTSSHWLCLLGHDWSLIWLNTILWLPFMEHCYGTYFRFYYNHTTRRNDEYPGIETKVYDWGGTDGIDYLGYLHTGYETVYAPTSAFLVDTGYKKNVSLRGAPFDFRKAPNENRNFFIRLKALIEDTYHRNTNSSVMLLCHSMGNLYINFFLSGMSKAWKTKFVRGYIAVSAPVGGAVKAVLAETAGIRFSNKITNMGVVQTVLRSMPSTGFNFPSPLFWSTDEVFAHRPGRNYTVSNYHQLFADVGNKDGWEMYLDTKNLTTPLWQPDVAEIYCMHGIGVQTPEILEWKTDDAFPGSQPNIIHGNGDGTVNLRSLQGCNKWRGVKVFTYPAADHKLILGDERFLADLEYILRLP